MEYFFTSLFIFDSSQNFSCLEAFPVFHAILQFFLKDPTFSITRSMIGLLKQPLFTSYLVYTYSKPCDLITANIISN